MEKSLINRREAHEFGCKATHISNAPTVVVWCFSRLRIATDHLHFKLNTHGDKGKACFGVHSSKYDQSN